ncbi:amino acid permease [Burkholderia sp. Ac-20353]|uniref:amino acid permease n=1 Tax=Burkholderia sp. Ac-20353 TaxID=2703894 RepID=UPI00197BAA52|nr:amino acid permease [Burkholderia sp. Ac-20353]MBN3791196.1 amino acid permease [Burkholderia sp. Ac-20353]
MQQHTMRRDLSSRQISFMALGMAIGVGLFLGSASAIRTAGPGALVAYLIGGAMIFLIMRALGEMAVHRPVAGSFSAYAFEYLGPFAGYLVGWIYWMLMVGVGVAETTAVGIYMGFWFPEVPQWLWVVSSIVAIAGFNLLNVKVYGELEFWFALVKVATILLMIAGGALIVFTGLGHHGVPVGLSNLWRHGGVFPHGVLGLVSALPIVAYSFAGVEMIGITAGEAREPQKVLPSAINSVLWRILIFYVGALFIIMALYPWNELGTRGSPFVTTFESLGLRQAAGIVNFVVVTAALSSFNCVVFSGARMLVSLAEHGLAPAPFATLSAHGSPSRAVGVTVLCMSVGVLLNYVIPERVFGWLMSVLSFDVVVIWAMIILTHMRFRQVMAASGVTTRFRMPCARVTSWICLVFVAFVFVMLGIDPSTRGSLYVGCALLVVLTAIYRRSVRLQAAAQSMRIALEAERV